ncbi:hypothetical protein LTR91_026117 [Friedmanniomyces endolithicus]|uniref:Uncharacterized protein n=1 Tax=Friedmanniomyces endolithicus TaxID=329885 RepID=A0AAN6JVB7_9PEZI|nr:hypothetical protein LTR94_017615 [Friedmanniomyces endolithicus]KAK0794254.1 hypothetical protein LTR59_007899 [Friedmanniomyces endolithicus]KAK0795648.1 hypothetical protein LTR75_010474 [Friedmanniomyces endolithicus]KAK0811165.1 hypothetical protein LTR38_003770 [Friedmanniomyces endolithicus]KAK0839872.1 hypothetical protein LTR03_010959 [Friedmanniomyces endolithicus]
MPLTTKQMEYLALAWQCFESEPKINYTKFAEVAGLKNARSAAELMRVAKNKLKTEYGSMSNGMQTANTPTRNATPMNGKKRARKATGEGEEGSDGHGDEDDEEGSPRKKVKGLALKEGGGVKAEVAVGSGEEDLELGFQ